MVKKIKSIGSDEDGETYYVIGDITRRSAFYAIKRHLEKECGIDFHKDRESFPNSDMDLQKINFVETIKCPHGGEHDGWNWWGKPAEEDETKPLGIGWIWSV